MSRTFLPYLAPVAIAALVALVAFGGASAVAEDEAAEAAPESFLDLEARRLGGDAEPLSAHRGKVLLVVNTASRCGLTPQYEGLQALQERYESRGFSVLGFPSNDFKQQEPGTDAEIGAFCEANYGVTFPMYSKVRVKGPDAHPVYAYLTSLPRPIGGPVAWNFQKYLVDRSGRVVARFHPKVAPQSPQLVAAIEQPGPQASSTAP